jgi:hypothetical protein
MNDAMRRFVTAVLLVQISIVCLMPFLFIILLTQQPRGYTGVQASTHAFVLLAAGLQIAVPIFAWWLKDRIK